MMELVDIGNLGLSDQINRVRSTRTYLNKDQRKAKKLQQSSLKVYQWIGTGYNIFKGNGGIGRHEQFRTIRSSKIISVNSYLPDLRNLFLRARPLKVLHEGKATNL